MKRKPLKESPNDICVCGHKRSEHGLENAWRGTSCRVGWEIKEKEKHCYCDKYLDRRHCKIQRFDDVLDYCKRHETDLIQAELVLRKVGSMATVSRRFTLFKLLGLLTEEGWSPIGIYSARAMSYGFNHKIYLKLRKEGIIVD